VGYIELSNTHFVAHTALSQHRNLMLNDHLGYMRELALVAQFASRVGREERTLLLLFHRLVFEVMSEMALFACDTSASLEMLWRENKRSQLIKLKPYQSVTGLTRHGRAETTKTLD